MRSASLTDRIHCSLVDEYRAHQSIRCAQLDEIIVIKFNLAECSLGGWPGCMKWLAANNRLDVEQGMNTQTSGALDEWLIMSASN